jgi:hypothetical protein
MLGMAFLLFKWNLRIVVAARSRLTSFRASVSLEPGHSSRAVIVPLGLIDRFELQGVYNTVCLVSLTSNSIAAKIGLSFS